MPSKRRWCRFLFRAGAHTAKAELRIVVDLAVLLFVTQFIFSETPAEAAPHHQWVILAIGFVVSFIVAYGAVAWFMGYVRRRGFAPFAVYRIVLGILVLALAAGFIGHY